MNQAQALEKAKGFLMEEVESITEPSKRAGKNMYICPLCGSGTGANASGAFSIDKDTNFTTWHCFACGKGGDIFDLAREYKKIDAKEAFKYVYDKYHITVDLKEPTAKQPAKQSKEGAELMDPKEKQDFTEQYKFFNSCLKETDYLEKRGISKATADRFLIGYCKGWKHPASNAHMEEALIIPATPHSYTARNIKPEAKPKYMNAGESELFGFDEAIGQSEWPVFVVEGEIDAMSFYEVGAYAIGLGSANNTDKLVNRLEEHINNHGKVGKLLICLDNDSTGQRKAKELVNTLEKLNNAKNSLKTSCIEFENITTPTAYKDANEFLTKDRRGFEIFVSQHNISRKEEYTRGASYYRLDDFLKGIKGNANTRAIPTGYEELDKVLGGGLYEGLYVVGAVSSLGKTTYILQMADQIAEAGEDVLIISLEMATDELIAKSISRNTASEARKKNISINYAKTNRGITDYSRYEKYNKQEKDLIASAIDAYRGISKHIYIKEGIGDIGVKQIREAVLQHEEMTGKKPVVIVDYLQMLAPYSERMTDKMNTDRNITELKRISRDYKIPLIVISSLNRGSYSKKISEDAFKESGAIEYTADILIGLQFEGQDNTQDFDLTKAKSEEPRKIELVILKNRSGEIGKKVCYSYYPMFNLFEEE